tara:strand:+ start:11428 stop:12573 length:1146 start_codon:yes stop_codon:yes gene_type:complete
MTDSLRHFATLNDNQEIVINNGPPIVPRFEGETCWERNHPTFISKKRKVLFTTPRKVGHSSIRFYLHSQNEMFDDDWIWLEDQNRNPKTWLNQEEFKSIVEDTYGLDSRIFLVPSLEKADVGNPYYKNAKVLVRGEEDTKKYLGDYNAWDFGQEIAPEWFEHRQLDLSPPFQTLSYFKDWTTYLLVRDPFERFVSGVITEMDNGISTPWKYEKNGHSEEGWEKLYNSAKRMLYSCEPEWLLFGGLDGQQMNHTFLLSRPLWNGKSMFDVYQNFIHYKHDIDYTFSQEHNQMNIDHDSLKKSAGVIDNLVELGFINKEIKEEHHVKNWQNSHSHTHMNITPHIRQHVLSELQEDEDMKEWWDKCREFINLDYEGLKNNQHKF